MTVTPHPRRGTRLLAWVLLFWLVFGVVAPALADDGNPQKATIGAAEEPNWLLEVAQSLIPGSGRGHKLLEVLGRRDVILYAFLVLNLIVFTETGLLIGFFLPGDSLLVTAGMVCALYWPEWALPVLLVTLSASAIIGDSVGYTIGFKSGPKIFNREKSLLFHKDHLLKAQAFYEKHGGKTIILARFMPFLRTFAPVVAGVGQMEYRRFVFYNVFGGLGWVFSMVLLGYFLPSVIQPALRPLFGSDFRVQEHIEVVLVLVVLVSIAPAGVMWLRSKFKGKAAAAAEDMKAPEQVSA
jgi:membrane-associated protein